MAGSFIHPPKKKIWKEITIIFFLTIFFLSVEQKTWILKMARPVQISHILYIIVQVTHIEFKGKQSTHWHPPVLLSIHPSLIFPIMMKKKNCSERDNKTPKARVNNASVNIIWVSLLRRLGRGEKKNYSVVYKTIKMMGRIYIICQSAIMVQNYRIVNFLYA